MKIDDRVLTKALINSNGRFMESLPTEIEAHNFSKSFERKMNHIILTNQKYGGNLWIERFVRYSAKAAVIILCMITINLVSVKAFDFDIWKAVVTKTGEFLNIHFEKSQDDMIGMEAVRLKIADVPDSYEMQQDYCSENLSVQHLTSEGGTITYTESLISETADVNIESGSSSGEQIGRWEVKFVASEDSITAFFTDEKFYHIVEIQGTDANKDFALKIIEGLEEQ